LRNDLTRRLAVIAMLAFGAPAAAQTLDEQQKNCGSPNFVLRIDACTAVIRSGQVQVEPLAPVLENRGSAYGGKGQLDRAIRDFNDALAIKPAVPAILYRRWWAAGLYYFARSMPDQALAGGRRRCGAYSYSPSCADRRHAGRRSCEAAASQTRLCRSGPDRGSRADGSGTSVYTERHNKREDLPCGAATY
jgi:hypothetical protein